MSVPSETKTPQSGTDPSLINPLDQGRADRLEGLAHKLQDDSLPDPVMQAVIDDAARVESIAQIDASVAAERAEASAETDEGHERQRKADYALIAGLVDMLPHATSKLRYYYSKKSGADEIQREVYNEATLNTDTLARAKFAQASTIWADPTFAETRYGYPFGHQHLVPMFVLGQRIGADNQTRLLVAQAAHTKTSATTQEQEPATLFELTTTSHDASLLGKLAGRYLAEDAEDFMPKVSKAPGDGQGYDVQADDGIAVLHTRRDSKEAGDVSKKLRKGDISSQKFRARLWSSEIREIAPEAFDLNQYEGLDGYSGSIDDALVDLAKAFGKTDELKRLHEKQVEPVKPDPLNEYIMS